MNKFLLYVSFIFLASCSWLDSKKQINQNKESQQSYSVGYNIGLQLKKLIPKGKDSHKIFFIGMEHALQGKKSLVDPKEFKKMRNKKQRKSGQNQKMKKSKKGVNVMEEGQTFLKQNKVKAGVKQTESGLQYIVVKEGTGKKATLQNNVEVHYRGTLIDGTEFDSSYSRNKTITGSLNGFIEGWKEGLQLMKEGAEYKFFIPSQLAYGDRSIPGIPADSVLIFKVELIKVN